MPAYPRPAATWWFGCPASQPLVRTGAAGLAGRGGAGQDSVVGEESAVGRGGAVEGQTEPPLLAGQAASGQPVQLRDGRVSVEGETETCKY